MWWNYAVNSPYFKEYIERQWTYYNNTRKKQAEVAKNVTYRNILGCTLLIMSLLLMVISIIGNKGIYGTLTIFGSGLAAIIISVLIRRVGILIGKYLHS